MNEHINRAGKFQSDKYPTCPPGKVPLSTRDKTAQDLLWAYAQRRRQIDAEFSADLEICLKKDGYKPGAHGKIIRIDGVEPENEGDFQEGLAGAIEFAYRNDIWPSARNIATLMGYKRPKLNGRMNRERKRIIHEIYDL